MIIQNLTYITEFHPLPLLFKGRGMEGRVKETNREVTNRVHSVCPESLLIFLMLPLTRFPSSRLILEDNVGLVDRRFF